MYLGRAKQVCTQLMPGPVALKAYHPRQPVPSCSVFGATGALLLGCVAVFQLPEAQNKNSRLPFYFRLFLGSVLEHMSMTTMTFVSVEWASVLIDFYALLLDADFQVVRMMQFREHDSETPVALVNLLAPFATTLSSATWYDSFMFDRRLQGAAGRHLDVSTVIMDGNFKLNGRSCGRPCAEMVHSAELGLYTACPCSKRPLYRKRRCADHDRSDALEAPLDEEAVVAHRRPRVLMKEASAHPYDVLLKPIDSVLTQTASSVTGRWVPASQASERQLWEYWQQQESTGYVNMKTPASTFEGMTCRTGKESSGSLLYKRLVRQGRLGGVLVACLSSGYVLHVFPFIGTETVLQVRLEQRREYGQTVTVLGAHIANLVASHEYVDKHFEVESIYGPKGASIVRSVCPLSAICLNINMVQTRKSQVSSLIQKISDIVQQSCRKRALEANTGVEPGKLKLKSCTLTSFTEAALWERCGADWQQCSSGHFAGRNHYSTLLNLDESYKFLRYLGLTAGGKGCDTTFDAASELNRVLQTGRCAVQFKSVQSFEDSGPIVNLAGVGNAHPSAFFDVINGNAGSHHVACAERFLLITGKPVEPHSPLPPGLDLPEGFQQWIWAPLLENMLVPLGLPGEAMQEEYARQTYEQATGEEDEGGSDVFLPSPHGYIVTLADGVESRLRFRVVRDAGHTWRRPELRFPNRNVPLALEEDVPSMTSRVLAYFEQRHRVIELSPAARALFVAFEATYNVQSAVHRTAEESAGRLGTAPWHIAVLACCNLIFELAIEAVPATGDLKVEERHILRAFDQVQLSHGIVNLWKSKIPMSSQTERPDVGPAAAALTREQRLLAACQAAPIPSQVPIFEPTQAGVVEEEAGAPQSPDKGACPAVKPLTANDREVLPMTVGYGPDGTSVQDPALGPVLHPDRVLGL
ncbi:unnamed protein product [Durusdinium trenchii]|uniref:Uncharacterized protein n=1 Tax=Durusdinium trenchii TaxID=1381693 RepID=A0ABP0SUT1_9DINO